MIHRYGVFVEEVATFSLKRFVRFTHFFDHFFDHFLSPLASLFECIGKSRLIVHRLRLHLRLLLLLQLLLLTVAIRHGSHLHVPIIEIVMPASPSWGCVLILARWLNGLLSLCSRASAIWLMYGDLVLPSTRPHQRCLSPELV